MHGPARRRVEPPLPGHRPPGGRRSVDLAAPTARGTGRLGGASATRRVLKARLRTVEEELDITRAALVRVEAECAYYARTPRRAWSPGDATALVRRQLYEEQALLERARDQIEEGIKRA